MRVRTMTSASAVPHRIGDTFRVKGLKLTDHFFDVPLDHGFRAPGAGDVPPITESSIEIFAREVRAGDKNDEAVASMPWLVFLQGGPGFECARLTESGGWIAHAVQSHRVLLLDQRGTGRSSRVSTAGLDRRFGADDVESKAKYLANFRADSIVADAELVRKTLLGDDSKWALLGQSFGGFCILRYLSVASGGVSEAFLTGGLPPLVHCADAATPAYRALIKRVRAQNAKFYRRFPMDVTRVRDVVKFVRDQPGGSVSTAVGGQIDSPRRPGARVRHAGHRGRDGEPSLPLREGVGGRVTHASLVRLSQVVRGRPRVRYQPAVRVSTRVHLLQRRRRQ